VRNTFYDVLRAVAIVRVVAYHATGWAPLSYVFPAMGVMFALGGTLMAAAVDRYGPGAVLRRFHRTLPPVWLIAAITVPLMLWWGLAPSWELLWWVVPLRDPPLYGFAASTLSLIWYLRQYLWFVLVSPVALPLFRRWPRVLLGAPFALMAAFQLGLPNMVPLKDFALYFACWILGFAHHDGAFERVPRRVTVPVGIGLVGLGAAWLFTHPSANGYDLNGADVAQCLWSAGFVVLVFTYSPHSMAWLSRRPALSTVVKAINQRAVTIYLWHQTVIVGLGTVVGLTGISLSKGYDRAPWLLAVYLGVAACALAVGWVEDLAARRRPVLVPT
jgi:peptidoglycan/LPS O-acetylase OafA/YrhL